MTDVPADFYEDGSAEELYKILRQSSAWKQHIIAPEDGWQHYRPYCHGGLPVFTIGSHEQRNPAETGDTISVMVAGVIEGPVQLGSFDTVALGDVVYAAHDGTNPYLTKDGDDSNVVCCWGVIIDDQNPMHFGEAVLAGNYENLYSIRMLPPACSLITG